jgi:hypothetical protein
VTTIASGFTSEALFNLEQEEDKVNALLNRVSERQIEGNDLDGSLRLKGRTAKVTLRP